MKCLVCNNVPLERVGIISCSGRTVCFKCLPEVIDSYLYLRKWKEGMKGKYNYTQILEEKE